CHPLISSSVSHYLRFFRFFPPSPSSCPPYMCFFTFIPPPPRPGAHYIWFFTFIRPLPPSDAHYMWFFTFIPPTSRLWRTLYVVFHIYPAADIPTFIRPELSLLPLRQNQAEHRPLIRRAGQPHSAFMRRRNLAYDRQTDAYAFTLAPVRPAIKPFEN